MKRYSRMISIAAAAAVACSQMIVPAAAEESVDISADEVISSSAVKYEIKTSASDFAYGDANGDGKINTADAVVVLKYAAEMMELDETQMITADTNSDGNVNTADAVLILKYAAGMITEF